MTAPGTITTTLRAGTYERVSHLSEIQSSEAREQERSVEQQRTANERACARYGWTLAEANRHQDPGRSASRFATKARKNWQNVLNAIKGRRFDVLVVWETSRASRDPETWMPLLAECRRNGVKIYVTVEDELYDLSKAIHWKNLASAGIDNAYESEKTSMRVKRGVDDHAEDGKPYGPIPYGYQRTYEMAPGKRKPLVKQLPHPDHAPVVQHIITSVYEGKSLMSIAAKLNGDGIPSPRGAQWTMRTVRRVALNPAYIGLRGHNGHITPGTWDAIVDESVFYGARRILTDPKRTTTRPGRAKWLASCIARCAVCQGWMCVLRRGENRTVYQCRDHGCVWIERQAVDEYLTTQVFEQLSRLHQQLPDAAEESAVETLRGQLAELRARLDGYIGDAAEGRIDRAFAAKVVDQLTTKIEQTQREIEQAITPPALAGFGLLDWDVDVVTRWERTPVSARREVLRLLFTSIVVAKGPASVDEQVTIKPR